MPKILSDLSILTLVNGLVLVALFTGNIDDIST